MDATTLQGKVYAGYGMAAQRIGLQYDVHRPTSAANPLDAATKIATLYAHFRAGPNYDNPNKYGQAAWYGTYDARNTKVGDYLTGNGQTYFIAAQQLLLPPYVVECNRTLKIYRPQQQSGVGAVGYGGDTAAAETALLSNWPASVLQGTKGEKTEAKMPGDTRSPWWIVLLPGYGSVVLKADDIITDDQGRRYVISSAEETDMGWRCTAMQVKT